MTTCINYSSSLVLRDVNSKYLRREVCNILWEFKVSLLHGNVCGVFENRIPVGMEALSSRELATGQRLEPGSDWCSLHYTLSNTFFITLQSKTAFLLFHWFYLCFSHTKLIVSQLRFLSLPLRSLAMPLSLSGVPSLPPLPNSVSPLGQSDFLGKTVLTY